MGTKRILPILVVILLSITLVLILRFNFIGFGTRVSPNASREECLKAAERYLQNNQPESAIYPLLLAIEKSQADFRAHYLLARVYYQTEVYPLSERECKISLELDPKSREALELLCKIKFKQGKSSWQRHQYRLSESNQVDLSSALTEFMFILEKSQDQKLIDSIANLTGGRFKITRLTNNLFFDDAPSFSHDGKRVVYHSDTSYFLEDYGLKKIELKKSQIFVMDAEGKNRTCMSPPGENESSERFAHFSHDDRCMVYEKENSPPHAGDTSFSRDRDIFLKDLNTGEIKRLTHNHSYDALPSFSPDDQEIIFVSDRPGGESSLYKLDLKTGEPKNIFMKESWNEKIGLYTRPRRLVLPYCPSFSPDGKKILLHAGYDYRGIFLLDPDGEDLKRLTDGETDCFFPSFSPDGQRIVLVSGYTDEEDLYIMDAGGSNRMRLTYDGGSKRYPSFSTDGKSIVFSGKREGEPENYFEIYLLNLEQTISKDKLKERLEELKKLDSEKAR